MLIVPAPFQGMIDQEPGELPCLGIVGDPQRLRSLNEQESGLDVVSERVVRRDRPPVSGQVSARSSPVTSRTFIALFSNSSNHFCNRTHVRFPLSVDASVERSATSPRPRFARPHDPIKLPAHVTSPIRLR